MASGDGVGVEARMASALDRAVVISLARRPAKRASMLGRARAAGLQPAVFEAVDGSAIDTEWLRAHGYVVYDGWRIKGHPSRFMQRGLKWGEIGCAISHLRVWEAAAARADCGERRPTLVLEDDILFPAGFASKLMHVLDAIARATAEHGATPPDLVYLLSKPIVARKPGEASPQFPVDEERQLELNPPALWKAGAYLLYPAGARKLAQTPYRANLVPTDDLLPTLAAGHPLRADLDALFAPPPDYGAPAADTGAERRVQEAGSMPKFAGHIPPVTRSQWFIAYAVTPNLLTECRLNMSDTENSAEM
eukprot:CAMPEP_0179918230 /NCGR_PEP_ID=MMETSP0983-20121128/3284_1 /TAXON_ID=483367 /ORGANISM="non described non described, Strain CCMP 2436" /LENGTH=306 /DNA_ID=CAMNT_0021821075 /DNA_START=1 /DNA_END=921 /DNA_ORIENTATION=-